MTRAHPGHNKQLATLSKQLITHMTSKTSPISAPPDPHQRKEPLPWQKPKPAEEDAGAPASLEAILRSPSYRQADEDTEFLNLDVARATRLQLDYLKAESFLMKNGVERTIVVFGSTRIPEPSAAKRKVENLRKAVAQDPVARELQQELSIAERLLAKSRYYDVARELGRIVSTADNGSSRGRVVIMTGGGPGIMEAANRGAFDCDAKSVGLNISLPYEQFPNPYVSPELCFLFHYFAMRKLHFMSRAKALVAFPGGYGTFDELFEALALIQTRKIKPLPIILVGEEFWRQAFDMDFLVAEGVIDAEDKDLFRFAESAADIWEGILRWYDESGESLFSASRVAQ